MPKYYLTEELIKKVYLIHSMDDEYIPFEKTSKKIIEKYKLSEEKYILIEDGHSLENQVENVLEWIHSKL